MTGPQVPATEAELHRQDDLLRLMPKQGGTALDIGARGGQYSALLAERYERVTALDLQKPPFQIPGVTTVAGDVRHLEFADNSFDFVFCAEVLEHVPGVERAAAEIRRVARRDVLIGVPYRQDTRVGRLLCRACGRRNPAWGHVNTFDEKRLRDLFSPLEVVEVSHSGHADARTNAFSAWLMDRAGNPWGPYQSQQEPCVYCGAAFPKPPAMTFGERLCAGVAARLDRVQAQFIRPSPFWIHIAFRKQ